MSAPRASCAAAPTWEGGLQPFTFQSFVNAAFQPSRREFRPGCRSVLLLCNRQLTDAITAA